MHRHTPVLLLNRSSTRFLPITLSLAPSRARNVIQPYDRKSPRYLNSDTRSEKPIFPPSPKLGRAIEDDYAVIRSNYGSVTLMSSQEYPLTDYSSYTSKSDCSGSRPSRV